MWLPITSINIRVINVIILFTNNLFCLLTIHFLKFLAAVNNEMSVILQPSASASAAAFTDATVTPTALLNSKGNVLLYMIK